MSDVLEPFSSEATRFVKDERAQGRAPAVSDVLRHLDGWAESQGLLHELATKKFGVSTFVTALLKSS
jgi:hypothetical protein